MITPALLITAAGAFIFSTSSRLGRVVDRVRAIAAALGPATVTDFSHELFRRERWGHMAESETYAHLEHLRLTGEAHRYEGDDGLVYVIESDTHSTAPA